ncbi:acyltransferase domain-containing protein [Spirillospora sp. NBC_00431]
MERVALLLPGQGSQHDRMALGLYGTETVFTLALDDAFAALGTDGARLRRAWMSGGADIHHVTLSQPMLFAVDYAMGRLVESWGVRPGALLGHSVGEVAGAVLAGVFSLRDAAGMLLDRIHRLAAAPSGGMLAVAATPAEVGPYLRGDVAVGAVNAPRQVVLAGLDGELEAVRSSLEEAGFISRPVPTTRPFHSPALAEAVAGASIPPPAGPPEITLYSGYTAEPLGWDEVRDPSYWARQPVAAVMFWRALDALLAEEDAVLVETGPGQELGKLARRHPAVRSGHSAVVSLLPARPGPPEADRGALREARAALAGIGVIGDAPARSAPGSG